MITSTNDSVLRKAAKRQGLLLKKSCKDSLENRGGYMLVDMNNTIIAGQNFNLTPEEVRDLLNS